MALTIVTWLWGDKYGAADVAKLAVGIKKHLRQPHRFCVISDRHWNEDVAGLDCVIPILADDRYLLKERGCFVRLRMFDPGWQGGVYATPEFGTDRIVCVDLDVVVTGPLDPLFDRPEPFVILQGANAANPCPFNGSLMMLRVGMNRHVWDDFSLDAAAKSPIYEFPDDQGWLWHKVPDAAGWKVGSPSGVYAFEKPGWPKGSRELPADARLVVFPGWRSPQQFRHLPWIAKNWTAEAA